MGSYRMPCCTDCSVLTGPHGSRIRATPANCMPVHSSVIHLLCLATLLAGCVSGAPRSTTESTAAVAHGPLPTGFPLACKPNEVQVMLLGTYHFEGSASDAVSGAPQDVRTPGRQAELEDLVERLTRWL